MARKSKKNRVEYVEHRLPESRLAFVRFPDDDGKFNCVVLVKKDREGKENISKLKGILADAAYEAFGDDDPSFYESCIKDGDKENDRRDRKGKEPLDGYDGHYVVSVKTNFQPVVLDQEKQKIKDPEVGDGKDIYSGCWAFVVCSPYEWDYDGKKEGISLNWCSAYVTDATEEAFSGGGHDAEGAYDDAKSSREPRRSSRRPRRDRDEDDDRGERSSRRSRRDRDEDDERDERSSRRSRRDRDDEDDRDDRRSSRRSRRDKDEDDERDERSSRRSRRDRDEDDERGERSSRRSNRYDDDEVPF